MLTNLTNNIWSWTSTFDVCSPALNFRSYRTPFSSEAWTLLDTAVEPRDFIQHVLCSINLLGPWNGLQSDIEFANVDYRKNFKEFMSRAPTVPNGFRKIDNGRRKTDNVSRNSTINNDTRLSCTSGRTNDKRVPSIITKNNKTVNTKSTKPPHLLPFCLISRCKKDGRRYYVSTVHTLRNKTSRQHWNPIGQKVKRRSGT